MEQLSKEEMRATTNQLLGIGALLLETKDLSKYIDQMMKLDNQKAAKRYISLAQILDKARDEISVIEPQFKSDEFLSDLLSKIQTSEAA